VPPAGPQDKPQGEASSGLRLLAELGAFLLSLPVERARPSWLGKGAWPESEAQCQARATQIIGRRIPAGTPVETAKALLEKDGFQCSFVENGYGIYLYGERSDATRGFSFLRTRVSAYHIGGKVTAVEVYCSFISL
jgi:hypothetical protein